MAIIKVTEPARVGKLVARLSRFHHLLSKTATATANGGDPALLNDAQFTAALAESPANLAQNARLKALYEKVVRPASDANQKKNQLRRYGIHTRVTPQKRAWDDDVDGETSVEPADIVFQFDFPRTGARHTVVPVPHWKDLKHLWRKDPEDDDDDNDLPDEADFEELGSYMLKRCR